MFLHSRWAPPFRDPGADRVANQVDAVEPGLIDEVEIKHREVGHRSDPWWIVGAPEAGMLGINSS
jgi:hypothetical protein